MKFFLSRDKQRKSFSCEVKLKLKYFFFSASEWVSTGHPGSHRHGCSFYGSVVVKFEFGGEGGKLGSFATKNI